MERQQHPPSAQGGLIGDTAVTAVAESGGGGGGGELGMVDMTRPVTAFAAVAKAATVAAKKPRMQYEVKGNPLDLEEDPYCRFIPQLYISGNALKASSTTYSTDVLRVFRFVPSRASPWRRSRSAPPT